MEVVKAEVGARSVGRQVRKMGQRTADGMNPDEPSELHVREWEMKVGGPLQPGRRMRTPCCAKRNTAGPGHRANGRHDPLRPLDSTLGGLPQGGHPLWGLCQRHRLICPAQPLPRTTPPQHQLGALPPAPCK